MKIQHTLTLRNELIVQALRSLDRQLAPQLGLLCLEVNTAAAAIAHRYFIENCFLEAYFSQHYFNVIRHSAPQPYTVEDGQNDCIVGTGIIINLTSEFSSEAATGDRLQFIYFRNGANSVADDIVGRNHGLAILDQDSNLVYHRLPGQDPISEWQTNMLAHYVEDQEGNYLFPGEPLNF